MISRSIVALLLLGLSVEVARAQLTAQQLVAPAIEKYGPEFQGVESAITDFKKGNFDLAREALVSVGEKYPELPPADVLMALLYLSVGRGADAQAAIDRAVLSEPTDPEAFVLLADLALRNRQHTVAELGYKRGSELLAKYTANPRRAQNLKLRITAGLASLCEVRGQPDLAEKHLKAWIALDPKNALPCGSLGRVLFQQKKYDEARAAFAKLGELDKDAPPVEIALGRLYADAGMAAEARQQMELAVKQRANDVRTRLTVTEWAVSEGLTDLAKENITAALNLDKGSLTAQVLSARLARQSDNVAEAEAILSAAVLRAPNDFSVTNELARVLAVSSDEKKRKAGLDYARRNFQVFANRSTPVGREAAITYAWLLLHNGRSADAEGALNTLPDNSSINSEDAYYAAKIYSQRNRTELAVSALRAALVREVPFPGRVEAQKLLDEWTGKAKSR